MWECTIDEHIKYIFIYYPTPTIPTTKPYFHTLKQVKQAATLQSKTVCQDYTYLSTVMGINYNYFFNYLAVVKLSS